MQIQTFAKLNRRGVILLRITFFLHLELKMFDCGGNGNFPSICNMKYET